MASDQPRKQFELNGVREYRLENGDVSFGVMYPGPDGKEDYKTVGYASEGFTRTIAEAIRANRVALEKGRDSKQLEFADLFVDIYEQRDAAALGALADAFQAFLTGPNDMRMLRSMQHARDIIRAGHPVAARVLPDDLDELLEEGQS